MAEDVTVDVDMSGLNRAMASLQDALIGSGQPGDASNLIRDETRRLGTQIMNFTPPFRGHGGANDGASAKSIGEQAVARNIISLFAEVEPGLIDRIGDEHGISDVDAWITGKSGNPIHLLWDSIDPTGDRMYERHQKARNRLGRVPKGRQNRVQGVWTARVVVPKGARAAYIKRTQARVGRWKATFGMVVFKLGGRVPAWVSRHFGKLGNLAVADTDGLMNLNRPTVVFGSRAPGNSRLAQRARDAVRARSKAIERRIRLIISGYNKDLANGYKARRKVNNSAISSAQEGFING